MRILPSLVTLLLKRTVHYKTAFFNFLAFFCASAECLISDRAALLFVLPFFPFLVALTGYCHSSVWGEWHCVNWWWYCQGSWSLIYMVMRLVKKHLHFTLSKHYTIFKVISMTCIYSLYVFLYCWASFTRPPTFQCLWLAMAFVTTANIAPGMIVPERHSLSSEERSETVWFFIFFVLLFLIFYIQLVLFYSKLKTGI